MTATRDDLVDWVYAALLQLGGEAKIPQIAEQIWKDHQSDLEESAIFFTWQYDMRWAAQKLRNKNKLAAIDSSARGVWLIKK